MAWPSALPPKASQPPVSILTPTYNRRKFIPALIDCIKSQAYPLERMEWVILDDGTDCVEDLIEPMKKIMEVTYLRSDHKLNVSEKRNLLHKAARGKILVTMDDDDYYPPERVSHAVFQLLGKKYELAGSTRCFLYFADDKSIWEVGPYNENHGTFGTMAYTKGYAMAHKCDESKTFAEEVEFTKRYTEPLCQLDPMKVMLVICHEGNTFNKSKMRDGTNPMMKKTTLKIKSFIRDVKLREFYAGLK